jgi:hypothetical protein
MAGNYNFSIDQGSDFTLNCTYKDDSGAAINITGMSIRAYARANKEDIYKKFEFTCSLITPASGLFSINLSSSTSSALDITKLNKFFYDVELVNGSIVTRLFEGIVTINREVTR